MGIFKSIKNIFINAYLCVVNALRFASEVEVQRGYKKQPSICDKLPYVEWSDEHDVVLLEDGKSVGLCIEALDVPSDCRPESYMVELHAKITKAFSTAFPLESKDPWVLQMYSFDDYDFDRLYDSVVDYVKEKNRLEDPFARPLVQANLKIIKQHFNEVTKPGGIFYDPLSEVNFRGKIRRHRFCIYRRYSETTPEHNIVEELLTNRDGFLSQLQSLGIPTRQLKGSEFHEWMVKHFHRNPKSTKGDVKELLKLFPYVAQEDRTHGYDFAQSLFHCDVETTEDGWKFDDTHHKCIVVKDLAEKVDIGVISREMQHGDNKSYALMDKFPEGTMYCIQVVYEDKQTVIKHLEKIESAAFGSSSVTKSIKKNVEDAHDQLTQNNMLFRCSEALFVVGDSRSDLQAKENSLKNLLMGESIEIIPSKEEIYPADTYLRYLPFNFNIAFDKKYAWRTSYQYADDIARLLTVYGRSKGDGQNPLNMKFTRNGEPNLFDPLNKFTRSSNMHQLIGGLTGGGKSVEINQLILNLRMFYDAQVIAMEAGDSFGNTVAYMKELDEKVEELRFVRKDPQPINPYSEWLHALEWVEKEEAIIKANEALFDVENADEVAENVLIQRTAAIIQNEAETLTEKASEDEQKIENSRDILSEMAMATRTMITGGEKTEEANIGRAEMSQISEALIRTMKKCRDNSIEHMLVSNVEKTFRDMSMEKDKYPETEREKFQKFARAIEAFTKGVRAQFVNRASKPISNDFDMMHIELGFLQESEYVDLMGTIGISLLAKILSIAEHNVTIGRLTALIIDEAHIPLKSPLFAIFIVLMIKVARKFGLIIILATQNIKDFHDVESRKVLSMIEHYQILRCSENEIEELQNFRNLTEEDISLIRSIHNEIGVYSEGVWLSSKYKSLYRSILPKMTLALAMTNPEEKAEINKIAKDQNITKSKAIAVMASRLKTRSNKGAYERKFF